MQLAGIVLCCSALGNSGASDQSEAVLNVAESCKYQPRCPGCPHFGLWGLSPVAREKLDELRRIWNVANFDEVPCEGRGARYRVRLSVRGGIGNTKIGIFERGTHRIVPIPDCSVHHPSIQSLLPKLEQIFDDNRLEPYDELKHSGLVRAVQLAVEPASQKIQAVVLIRDPLVEDPRESAGLSSALTEISQLSAIQGLFLGALPRRTNSLQAESFIHVSGQETLRDTCGGVSIYYPPGAFGQANPLLHRKAVERIIEAVPRGARACEYYAGVGTIGLGLVERGHEVFFNELGTGSLEGLKKGLAAIENGATLAAVGEGRAGDFADAYTEDDVVIVDPPRKGLDPGLAARLSDVAPLRLIYLSCGIDALLRESTLLARTGKYSCSSITGFSYFPFTDHVETLLVLSRRDCRASP